MATGDTTNRIKPDEDKTIQSTSTRTGETKSGLTGSFKYNITVHDEFEPSSLKYSPEYEGVTTLTAGTTLSADITLGTPTFDPSKEETISFNPTENFIYVDTITSGVKIDAKTQAVTGEGILDKLMETTNTHLQAQFEAGRIRLEDYANAYVSILTNNLQVATQLAMGMSNDRVMRYKAEQEIKTMQSQDRVMRYKAEQEIKQANAQARLIEVQRKNAIAEREVLTAKTNAEINKMIDDMYQQDRKITDDLETAKTQRSAIQTKTSDDHSLAEKNGNLLDRQKEVLKIKTNAEVKKLANDAQHVAQQAKTETEKQALYMRQRIGFNEDSKLKLMKQMSDVWSLGYSIAGENSEFQQPTFVTKDKDKSDGINVTSKANMENITNHLFKYMGIKPDSELTTEETKKKYYPSYNVGEANSAITTLNADVTIKD